MNSNIEREREHCDIHRRCGCRLSFAITQSHRHKTDIRTKKLIQMYLSNKDHYFTVTLIPFRFWRISATFCTCKFVMVHKTLENQWIRKIDYGLGSYNRLANMNDTIVGNSIVLLLDNYIRQYTRPVETESCWLLLYFWSVISHQQYLKQAGRETQRNLANSFKITFCVVKN